MKQKHLIRWENGEQMPLWELENGEFACPICGEPWPFPPYVPSTVSRPLSCPAIGDICMGCDVEFGVEEGCAPYAPIGWMHRQYAEYRTQWLNRGGWTKEQLAQLERNLGITEAQARADAERLKAGKWEL